MKSTLRFQDRSPQGRSCKNGKRQTLLGQAVRMPSAFVRNFVMLMLFALAGSLDAKAQQFVSGNVAVLLTDENDANTAASIVEVNPAAAGAVSTTAIPGTVANGLRFSATATSTCYLSNSNDGSQLIFTGANSSDAGASNVNTLNPRGVGFFNQAKTYALAANYTASGTNQSRSASTLNNTAYYIGDQGGMYTNGSTSASPTGNYRSIRAFGGTIYAFTSSTSNPPVGTISALTGGSFTGLPGLANGTAQHQDFYMISSGSNGSAFDILYVLQTTSATAGTIYKYSLVSGTWTANGTHATGAGGFGLAAKKQGNGAYLFLTSGTGATTANNLIRLNDVNGYNQTISITNASNLTLYTAPAGRILKGVAFAPVSASPITVTGSFAAVNTVYGTPSTATNVSVSGSGLTADVVVTPPAGFEVSQTSATSGFAASQTLVQTSGTLAATTVFVRLAATTVAGSYSGNVAFVSGTTTVNAAVPNSTVSAKAITISGATAQNKVYDRTLVATITGATANDLVNGDVITVSGGGSFADFLVADDKPVTASLVLAGTNAASYTVTQPTGLTANITPKALTLSPASVASKTYDGSNVAVLTATLSGVISPDEVLLNPSAAFSSISVGSAIAVNSFSTIFGNDAFNYTLTQPTGLSADITAKALTILNATAQNKVYDGNTDAVITGTLDGVIAPDEVTLTLQGVFASPEVGLGIEVTSTSFITGDIANYTLTQPTGLTANISAEALEEQTITFTALTDVVYGAPSFDLTATASSGLAVAYSSSDENVATISGSTVTIHNAGTTIITATQSGDLTYDSAEPVSQPLNVLPKELTIASASAQTKVYDGTDSAVITGTLSGVINADDVALTASGTFAQASVGSVIAVTSTSTLTGTETANYTLVQPTGLSADITPKELIVENAVASDKTYDGTTATTISGGDLFGAVNGDDVSFVSGEAQFSSPNVGTDIDVTSNFTLTGSASGNYTIAQALGLTADIFAATVTVFDISAENKVYDGTTAATIVGSPLLDGIIGADDVSVSGAPTANFDSKNVGVAKPVTVSGYTLSGAQAGNYTLAAVTGVSADVTVASLTINNAVAADKTFDGTTAATITGTLSGVISPDVVTLVGTGTFAQATVGTDIPVTATATTAGTDGANYIISPQPTGLSADILAGPSILAVGDISILGFQVNAPDTFAFVTWVDLAPNTIIKFTDNAFLSAGSANATNNARGGEAFVIWRNNGAVIPAGTVIRITDTGSPATASAGTIVSGTLDGLSASGDAIFAYQGAATSGTAPDFSANTNPATFNGTILYGLYAQGSSSVATWLATGTATSNTSYLPSQLNVANGNIALGASASRGQYNGSRTNQATFAAYKALVNNPANWTTASGSGTTTLSTTPFTLVTGPTASVLSGDNTICAGETAQLAVNVTGGTAPFTVTYSDGTSEFSVTNYTSGSAITVNPSTTTTFTLVSVIDANAIAGSGNSGTATVTVNQLYPFFVDSDLDGYGAGASVLVCSVNATTPPAGYSDNAYDCDDSVAAVHPNATEIPYNGIDDDCDNTIDEGSQLFSQVLQSQCGTTLAAINSSIGAVSFSAPVDGYRFRVINTTTNAEQTIDRTAPNFQLTALASYEYATTYSISVMLRRNGTWLNYYGPACLVSTPAVLSPGGAAAVTPSQCGITLPNISTLIATTSLQGVTGYRFRVTNLTDPTAPNQVQTLDRATHWFSLPMLATYAYGTTYSIEVALKTGNNTSYSGYGAPCSVTTPAVPVITNPGTATSATMLFYTTSMNRATSYRFELGFMVAPYTTIIVDRTNHYFSFSNVPGYVPGGQYAVRVAVMTSGTWSPFGEAELLTAPGATRGMFEDSASEPSIAFRAVAYPNPYAEGFSLDMDTPSDEKINVKVYDMVGKLLENVEVAVDAIETHQFGSRFPSGVYNVIVTQGSFVKTLRVIKR